MLMFISTIYDNRRRGCVADEIASQPRKHVILGREPLDINISVFRMVCNSMVN